MDDFALGSDNDNDEIILGHSKKNTDVTDTVKDTDTNDVTISSGRIATPISVDTISYAKYVIRTLLPIEWSCNVIGEFHVYRYTMFIQQR